MKTYSPKKSNLTSKWYIVDAKDKILGRIAAPIAAVLRGKHKPVFSPHLDCGDFVIIINAAHVKTTGRKLDNKIYYTHSGYLGSLRQKTLRQKLAKEPTKVLSEAIAGMIPRNRLADHILNKLKIYADDSHPHSAQNPTPLEL